MAARHRGMKKAGGGGISGVQVPGADVIKEAEASNQGFKKGGKVVKAMGKKARARGDRVPRKADGGLPVAIPPTGPGLPPQPPSGVAPPSGKGFMPVQAPTGPSGPPPGLPPELVALAEPPRAARGGTPKRARGGAPISAAGKGGKDAPTKGSECA